MASKAQGVVAALVKALQVNHAGTVYPPRLVQPMLNWPDATALPAGLDTVYLVRVLKETEVRVESCSATKRLQVVILAAHRCKSASENPFKQSPNRLAVSDDLAHDVEQKLRLAGKLDDEAVTVFDGLLLIDHEAYYMPRWVIPHIETGIRFRYAKDER